MINSAIDAFRSGLSYKSPTRPQEIRNVHEYELRLAIEPALNKQKQMCEHLGSVQNRRLDAEIALKNNDVSVLPQTRLDLTQQVLDASTNECQASIAAKEADIELIKVDIMYNNAKIWWPDTEAERSVGERYVADKQHEMQNLDREILVEKEKINELEQVKNAVKFTADFYKELTEKFGERSAILAQDLADRAKGKQIRNVDDALKAFERYTDVLGKKFSVKDREAIAKALEFIDKDLMARNLQKFSKAFGIWGKAIDGADFVNEFKNAIETGNWKPFFVKAETIGAGMAVSALLAVSMSIMTATPIGIVGFSLLMAVSGAFIDDNLIEKLHDFILKV